MTRWDPVRVGMRCDSLGPAHATISVWVGRNHGARANCGTITMRRDEWRELELDADTPFDILPPLDTPNQQLHPTTGLPLMEASPFRCVDCAHYIRFHHREQRPQCGESIGPVVKPGFPPCSRFKLSKEAHE